jgi:hypothetical protein
MVKAHGRRLIWSLLGSLGTAAAAVMVSPTEAKAQNAQGILKDFKPTQAAASEYDTPATAEAFRMGGSRWPGTNPPQIC